MTDQPVEGLMIDTETYRSLVEFIEKKFSHMSDPMPFVPKQTVDKIDRYYAHVRQWREWKSMELRDLWTERLDDWLANNDT